MKILGLNGKPLKANGKVFLPPSAGSGVDITSTAVSDGVITIPKVTGDVCEQWQYRQGNGKQ